MAVPNLSEIATTTLKHRSGAIADNVSKNNAILARLKQKGRIQTVSGGESILEELSFQENSNGGWYSGYDFLPTAAQDVLSAAEFSLKEFAVAVTISGLERLQNSGKDRILDLLAERIENAEATMANRIAEALYSDGTGSGGKELTGLAAAVPVDPTTGTYGAINRATYSFWRSYALDTGAAPAAASVQGHLNTAWSNLVRGADRPDLLIGDGTFWAAYVASLQALQRFSGAETASLGFPSIKYMDADVVLDGGVGGYIDTATCLLLNTKYLKFRPHKDQNFAPLPGGDRTATNQNATVSFLGFTGNLTCKNSSLQGRITFS